ncbi:MAG TPA: hypothetical protein VER55_08945, partial [Ardenticatenaceae bacterium]|nr:hypothetical protein [Ardenticatenaceae bacterium]
DAAALLGAVPGVTTVQQIDNGTFEVECRASAANESATSDPANGATPVECRPALAELAVTSGWGLLELRAAGMSLEDIFLELTGSDPEWQSDDDDPLTDEPAEE